MPQWDASFYNEWDETRQDLFDAMADELRGEVNLYEDGIVQSYVDLLFGEDQLGGDRWNQIHEALNEYMAAEYGIPFDEIWDWEAWREAYGND